MKRKLLSLALALTMILSAFAGVITISAAEPTATAATPAVIEMLEGAAIRCADPSGIRFISKISTANAEAATEMGTYIFPYDKYEESGCSTPELYFAYADQQVKANTEVNINNYYVKVLADKGVHADGEDTYLYAALVNIQEKNYGRDFAALSYAVIDGVTHYSEFNTFKNVRNIREVAAKAYNDFEDEENKVVDGYTYKYQVAEGKWSCYSPEQREVIAKYDDAIFRLMVDENGHVWNGANHTYSDPFLPAEDSTEKYGTTSGLITINPLPSITDGALDFTYSAGYCGFYRTEFISYNADKSLTDFGKNLSDGFSFEVMFFAEADAAKRGDYRGIIDMVHAGGFGVNICGIEASASDEVMLRFECGSGTKENATKSDYVEYKQALKVERWYHLAVSYTGNGDNAQFTVYLDGELVATLDAKGDLQLPMFRGENYTKDYLCIGGTYVASYDDKFAWEGVTDVKVKGFNLYSTPVTESEVTSMYGDYQRTESVWLNDLLTTKHQLRADADGNFNVLVLSDVQFNTSNIHQETLNNIKTLVDREQPDLVVFNGDNCFNIRSVSEMEAYVTNMTAYLEEKQIPWAHVYGNHDAENNRYWTGEGSPLTREEQQAVFESFEYCVSESGMADVYGIGNFVLPVFSHDGSEILYNVWCLDSGTSFGIWDDCAVYNSATHGADKTKKHATIEGNTVFGHYEPMKQNQVDWYAESTRLLEEYNGNSIPAMMAFHIPLQASIYAWQNRFAADADCVGENRDDISAHSTEPPLWEKIQELGDVKAIINSHDHLNDFAVTYKGVRFCYTASMGTLEYYDPEMLGGRVVSFTPDGMTTEMSYVQEREALTPYTPIFDLDIDANNNVTNAIPCRPDLTESTNTGSIKKVDESLGTKVLSFSRDNSYADGNISAYQLPTIYGYYNNQAFNSTSKTKTHSLNYLKKIFADGFAMEVVFKVNSISAISDGGYVGIVDYEETGGFGLNVYNDGGTARLQADVGDTVSNYTSIATTIEVGKWYHCVVNYDEQKLELYLNGVNTVWGNMSGKYKDASAFATGTNYICIGGAAQNGSSGTKAFIGDIAEVKILPEEVTADQVEAMADVYGLNASTAPILDLVIGNDRTVKNGNILGTPLTDTNYEGSVKEVVHSDELAKKVLSFSRTTGYNTGAASTYNMAAAGYNSLFADGFTLETVFRVDSTDFDENYVGIVDYYEGGGWNLVAYKSSTAGKASVRAEFGVVGTPNWSDVRYEVDLNTWYHCVVVYDGNGTISMYINGNATPVSTKTGLGAWRAPAFSNRSGEEYICIGGCSQAWSDVDPAVEGNERSTGINAFMGQIAKVTILPDAVSPAEVTEMYQNATQNG